MTDAAKTPAPAPTPAISLLPTPVALVCGGALAAVAAQLFVSADDFTRLYEIMGLALPVLLTQLVDNPVLLPVGYLLVAVGALLSPRIVLPWSARAANAARGVALAGLGLVMFHAAGVAWLLPNVMHEVQKSLQQ
jgi:hypothetical protein